MYLKEIEIRNYGAIKHFNYKFPFDSNGNPLPVIMIGKNGSGKTLILSNILHSLIQYKRNFYREIKEVTSNRYYRIGSKSYIRSGELYAYEKIVYSNNAKYVDLMVLNQEQFVKRYNESEFSDVNFKEKSFIDTGFYNHMSYSSNNEFVDEVFLYFPVDRYYIPTWKNSKNDKLKFSIDDNYIGESSSSIVKYNLLDNIEEWILDVIIDKMLYEGKNIVFTNETGEIESLRVYEGKNEKIQVMLNQLLSSIFRNSDYESYRLGISTKTYRKIAVIGKKKDGTEKELVNRFSNLSSGEIMIFGIFATILKEYDKITGDNSLQFHDIKGIVLIDEVDIHLHSDLVKEVLPELIKIFPKIQFLISSHSPFFLLGMKETFLKNCQFVALPNGTILENIEYFEEIQKCYSIIDRNHTEIIKTLNQYEKEFNNLTKTLIITEGKSDWKHLKNALSKLKAMGEFTNLDLEYLEYQETLGDSKLENLLKNLSKVPRPKKIIGVFDNDSAIGKKYSTVSEFGNNVYGCCLEDTQGFNCEISIEMLYTRLDITREDKIGRRLYLSDEFTEKSHRLKTNPDINCNNKTLLDAHNRKIIKIVDKEVFNINEESLALSKEQFAQNILDNIEGFSDVNVDGFRKIFEVITSIIVN